MIKSASIDVRYMCGENEINTKRTLKSCFIQFEIFLLSKTYNMFGMFITPVNPTIITYSQDVMR